MGFFWSPFRVCCAAYWSKSRVCVVEIDIYMRVCDVCLCSIYIICWLWVFRNLYFIAFLVSFGLRLSFGLPITNHVKGNIVIQRGGGIVCSWSSQLPLWISVIYWKREGKNAYTMLTRNSRPFPCTIVHWHFLYYIYIVRYIVSTPMFCSLR